MNEHQPDPNPVYYVYLHKKPDGTVFYVGKGKGRRAYQKSNRNRYWKKLLKECKQYSVEIIKQNMTEQEALDYEALKISEIGIDNLCNILEGGEFYGRYKRSEETIEKLSNTSKRRLRENPEQFENFRKAQKKLIQAVFSNPESREKALRALKEGYNNYRDSLTEEQKEAERQRLAAVRASERFKEGKCRKLVVNRFFFFESAQFLAKAFGRKVPGIPKLNKGEYLIDSGFLIEDYDREVHGILCTIDSLEDIERIYPINQGAKPIKNSKGQVFLSRPEAADSVEHPNAITPSKRVKIGKAVTNKTTAYGLLWMRPTEEEVREEVLRRAYEFINKIKEQQCHNQK